MEKVNNVKELKELNTKLKKQTEDEGKNVVVRVAMATCSIASGSQPVIDYFNEEMKNCETKYIVKSTGCTGLCHSEPTVEVLLPGKSAVMFGKVDKKKAAEILNSYIKEGKEVAGTLEVG